MECEYESDQDNKNCIDESIEISFLDLNDHCLLKVSSYLGLLDTVNLRHTCERLKTLSQMAVTKFKHFDLDEYADDEKNAEEPRIMLHFDRTIHYIAPVVESIETADERKELLRALEKYDFPKLKSLSVSKANHLRWINNKNFEKLTIYELKRDELNNFSGGVTNLKRLRFSQIGHDVPTSELLYFFENNPNIECLGFYRAIDRPIPDDFFTKFKNLKTLELSVGKNFQMLENALQIEDLSTMIISVDKELDSRRDVMGAITAIVTFLSILAPKKTLKSLNLMNMRFDQELFTVLASLNLISLSLVVRDRPMDFHNELANTPFPVLKYLDFLGPVDVETLFTLIKNLTALERIKFSMLQPYDRQALIEQLNQLLRVSTNTRPELEIDLQFACLIIKVNGIKSKNIF